MCTGPLGERVQCTDFQWPPEEPESLRSWPQNEMDADLKKAAREIDELKKGAKKADALSKELAKASPSPLPTATEKKCKDYAGNPIWCDGSAIASPSPPPTATEKRSPSPLATATEKKSPSPLATATEKKCKDYAGNPIWCDGSAITSPSPQPTTTH